MNQTDVKSANVAGLLGIFLGTIGAHDWYLGQTKKAMIHVCLAASGIVVQILASAVLPNILSFSMLLTLGWLFMLLKTVASLAVAVSGIWGLIEGIQILAAGDAGLARQGYRVANSVSAGNGTMGGNGVNGMSGMNGMGGVNGYGMNGDGTTGGGTTGVNGNGATGVNENNTNNTGQQSGDNSLNNNNGL